ncbi:isochorismate synthase [Gordonibacter massiliensis (ex Traore et al. 2017)]|uniref:isochorismate synthase n=1 Tax=Gordonibacter massiliensis (ex Traore et al. 2017) TaxID=1841863 RepID=A0A842J7C9_9ACTN|nr:isochorismate synthase [Gordonibacter massiliensis (ex Traore et al. 2017)]MBC2887872.1 isochorismate synthase [Gordonibacter massiliensis (ex Traore et al. 2017)]
MTRIFSHTRPIDADIVDAFCMLQKGFTDQFVYYDKRRACRYMGLGRCIALPTLDDAESELEGPVDQPPVYFSFNRFDAENPAPTDELFEAFPRLKFMLPEIVLIENERGTLLQVNSLGPVYAGRIERFARQALAAPPRRRQSVPYSVEPDSREAWRAAVGAGLAAIEAGRVDKVVLSRRQRLVAERPFSSKDLLVNLIDGPARGTVLLYRYADVFFCGCTPELLVRKTGNELESMCLAGTCPAGATEAERKRLASELMADPKNRAEHDYVVRFIREVFRRTCYDVDVPAEPGILPLTHVQHLCTPARARILEGVDLWEMKGDLHPTPAVAGTPVGEAKMLIRSIEAYNRGFFAGACGYVDGDGDGEFSVALRTGVFDGEIGWVYAGCGIVAGSVADDEYDEIGMKLMTVLSAFSGEDDADAAASPGIRSAAAVGGSRTAVRHASAIDPSSGAMETLADLTNDQRVGGAR